MTKWFEEIYIMLKIFMHFNSWGLNKLWMKIRRDILKGIAVLLIPLSASIKSRWAVPLRDSLVSIPYLQKRGSWNTDWWLHSLEVVWKPCFTRPFQNKIYFLRYADSYSSSVKISTLLLLFPLFSLPVSLFARVTLADISNGGRRGGGGANSPREIR